MDAIGSSTKLMWFFVFIYSFPILLLILSVTIWSYKKFKRLAFISFELMEFAFFDFKCYIYYYQHWLSL